MTYFTRLAAVAYYCLSHIPNLVHLLPIVFFLAGRAGMCIKKHNIFPHTTHSTSMHTGFVFDGKKNLIGCIDCAGADCFHSRFLIWYHDGYCDDGTPPFLDYNCPEFQCDGGDCDDRDHDCVSGTKPTILLSTRRINMPSFATTTVTTKTTSTQTGQREKLELLFSLFYDGCTHVSIYPPPPQSIL